jgi:protein gp37
MAARFSGPGQPYEGTIRDGRWSGLIRLVPEKLNEPLHWRRPRRIFVNSMSDLFHDGVPFEFIAAVFGVMAACPQHTFQVLTKRPARALEFFRWAEGNNHSHPETICLHYSRAYTAAPTPGRYSWPIPNVHLGVSVEDQATADERIPLLLQSPAAVRWVSYEPALAAVDFSAYIWSPPDEDPRDVGYEYGPCPAYLEWVIVGGESGPNARPFHVQWARSTVAQCKAAGVACFVKQMGANVELPPDEMERMTGHRTTTHRWRLNDKAGADPSEWPEDLRVQEFPHVP